ncbi:AAA family ATPase [Vibrio parahaemolyticus]
MDKQIILAVAGSGKTQNIINRIENDSRALIVTYTVNNTSNLKKRILNKLGIIPKGVRIYTYFSFLMSFCVKPIVGRKIKINGISYNDPPKFSKRKTKEHYISSHHKLYHNRIAKLMIDFNKVSYISERIEKYFDLFCIDEVQDFAANDFNLLCDLAKTNTEILLVGDFFQHTFDTSRDGNIQKNLHNNKDSYLKKLEDSGYTIDLTSLSHSYRCSPTICTFITNNLGIPLASHRNDEVSITLVSKELEIDELMSNDNIVKLFFKESHKYNGRTDNWGNTKGLDDFNDICIVLNKTSYKAYKDKMLSSLAPSTKNKLYVAFTRAKGKIYLIDQELLGRFKK